jgi:hypothetical protein
MTTEELNLEKSRYIVATNGGISLPTAGFIYWLLLGIAGYYLAPRTWCLLGFFTSGLIFPLGLLLSKPMKSNLMLKAPLSGVVMPAMTAMFLSWPMIIAGYVTDFSLVPLFLAIGMTLHWPVIGWMYGSKTCIAHAISRVVVVTAIWFALPEQRFTLLPVAVSIIYFITIFGLKLEVKKLKR